MIKMETDYLKKYGNFSSFPNFLKRYKIFKTYVAETKSSDGQKSPINISLTLQSCPALSARELSILYPPNWLVSVTLNYCLYLSVSERCQPNDMWKQWNIYIPRARESVCDQYTRKILRFSEYLSVSERQPVPEGLDSHPRLHMSVYNAVYRPAIPYAVILWFST